MPETSSQTTQTSSWHQRMPARVTVLPRGWVRYAASRALSCAGRRETQLNVPRRGTDREVGSDCNLHSYSSRSVLWNLPSGDQHCQTDSRDLQKAKNFSNFKLCGTQTAEKRVIINNIVFRPDRSSVPSWWSLVLIRGEDQTALTCSSPPNPHCTCT